MNIIRNDRVVLIKEMESLKQVGNAFEVANILDDAIVLRDADTKIAVASVDIKEFDQYFKKVDEVEGWTAWSRMINPVGDMIAEYRTNFKKVEVRITNDMLGYPNQKVIRSTATCSQCDEFDISFGIHLAYLRCEQKYLKNEIDEYDLLLNEITDQKNVCESKLVQNKSIMKKMLSSLE